MRHGLMLQMLLDVIGNGNRIDLCEAGIVAPLAQTVAMQAARTTIEVGLYDIVVALTIAQVAGIRVRSPPKAYHPGAGYGGKMHVDAVHREHHIKMRHYYKFLLHAAKQLRGVGAVLVLGAPAVDLRHLGIASAKQEDTA